MEEENKINEENLETPVENLPSQDSPVNQESQKEDAEIIEIKKYEGEKDYSEVIEEKRVTLYKQFKKSRTISNVLMLTALLIAFGSMFLITLEDVTYKIIGWVIILVTIIGMIVYHCLTKNKMPNLTQVYIREVTDLMNQRIYDDDRYQNVVTNPKEKIVYEDLAGDGAYQGVSQTASRNLVKGQFMGISFKGGETALYTKNPKGQRLPLFVGKYISMPNALNFEGHFAICLKKLEKEVDAPNGLGDLTTLKEEGNFSIHGVEGADYSVLGEDFLSRFQQIEINEHILNIVVTIWAGHTACYVSFDDSIMALPFDKPFSKEAYEIYKINNTTIMEAIASIAK